MNRKTRRSQKSRDAAAKSTVNAAQLAQRTRADLQAARTLDMQGRRAQAEQALAHILTYNPACAPALHNLGIWAAQREDFRTAEKYLGALAEIEPENADVLCALAVIRVEHGQIEEAVKLGREILRRGASSSVLNRLGTLYREIGMMEEARGIFETAIRQSPDDVAGYFNISGLRKFEKGDAEVARLLALHARRESLSPKDRTYLCFTLGEIFLKAGDAAQAFAFFDEANKERRKGFAGYDVAALEKYTDDIIRAFTPEVAKRLKEGAQKETKKTATEGVTPVLIIGMPRSGSTLTDQILASHPAVTSIGESMLSLQSLQPLFGGNPPALTPGFIDALTPEACRNIGKLYLSLAAAKSEGRQYVADKQLFNFQWLGVLLAALPGAKIIHCTRDARDMGLSIWRTVFTKNDLPWAYDQRDIARYCKAHDRLMAHWRKLFPDAWLTQDYEEMTRAPEARTRRLLDYCGLPWDDACLRFYETARPVRTASVEQVRRPVYRDAVARWKKYETYLAPLIEELEAT